MHGMQVSYESWFIRKYESVGKTIHGEIYHAYFIKSITKNEILTIFNYDEFIQNLSNYSLWIHFEIENNEFEEYAHKSFEINFQVM